MIEALAFGFFAYFGTEIGEFTHKKYNELVECVETRCHTKDNEEPKGEIVIKNNEESLSTTILGAENE